MWVRKLAGHVEPKVLIIINITVTQPNQQSSTLYSKKLQFIISNYQMTGSSKTIQIYIWLNRRKELTCTKVCLRRIGSREGSSVSPTSSIRTGRPGGSVGYNINSVTKKTYFKCLKG